MSRLGLGLVVCLSVLLIVLSYFFADRQLVWFLVAHHSRHIVLLKIFANDIRTALAVLVFVYYLCFLTRVLCQCSITGLEKSLFWVCNSIVIGQSLKDVLKAVFGRYWPSTFMHNNPSLVSNHVYGFNWFSPANAFGSFPSGHTTFIFSFSVSVWFLLPKLRPLAVLLAALVVIGQVGMYYHFLSDVIAGALLGTLVAMGCVRFWHKSVKSER